MRGLWRPSNAASHAGRMGIRSLARFAVVLAVLASCSRDSPGIVRLTHDPAEDRTPRCSPDGRRIAFASDRAGNADLFILDLETTATTRVTRSSSDETAPAWSPAGTALVFHRLSESAAAGPGGLWILDLDTGGERLLVADTSTEMHPDWSPDGGWVAFYSSRHGQPDLFRVSVDGLTLERLTTHPLRDVWPRHSPDGSMLVFFSRRDTDDAFDELYTLDLASRAVTRITVHPEHHDFTPDWSPAGDAFVVAESRPAAYRRELAILDRRGLVLTRFAGAFHRVFQPSWCRDGRIVFAARVRDGEAADLFSFPVDRTALR